jgi:hypothetical protein
VSVSVWAKVVRQSPVRSAVRNPKTEQVQDGAAQSAFEKPAESGRATCRGSMLERSARLVRYGPHMSLR